MTPRPVVVLLAGRSGAGKSTFAPYLAHHLGAAVLDSDTLFAVPRRVVGDANGLGMAVVSDPLWRESVHPRLLDLLLALAACAATAERPAVAVSPWTAMLCSPARFAIATEGMEVDWRWVMLQAAPEICRARIAARGWSMDHTKLADWDTYDRACRALRVPEGAYVADTSSVSSWPALGAEVARWVKGGTLGEDECTAHSTRRSPIGEHHAR